MGNKFSDIYITKFICIYIYPISDIYSNNRMNTGKESQKTILLLFEEIGVFGGEGIGVRIFISRSRKRSN